MIPPDDLADRAFEAEEERRELEQLLDDRQADHAPVGTWA